MSMQTLISPSYSDSVLSVQGVTQKQGVASPSYTDNIINVVYVASPSYSDSVLTVVQQVTKESETGIPGWLILLLIVLFILAVSGYERRY